MSGSGLEEVWSQLYAENTVPHLMSAKAYSRALRGYVLVHSALHNLFLDEIISSLPQEERSKTESAYDAYYNGECNILDETKESAAKIEKLLVEKKAELVHTAHYCAVIHQSMSSVTKIVSKGSEQHEALFLRLIAIAQRTPKIEDYFHYELTADPMSLFKDGMMRKPNKALLRNAYF